MCMCNGAQLAPSSGAQVRTTLEGKVSLTLTLTLTLQVRTTLEGKVSNLVEYPGYAVVVCMCLAVALDQVKG